jgi:hypothetical protein
MKKVPGAYLAEAVVVVAAEVQVDAVITVSSVLSWPEVPAEAYT